MPATQADAVMEAWAAACRRHVGGGMGGAGGPFGGYSCGGGNDPPRGRSPVTRGCRCGVPALGIPCGAHGEVRGCRSAARTGKGWASAVRLGSDAGLRKK